MNWRADNFAVLIVLASVQIFACKCPVVFAQNPPRERPQLKDFGSSLKRLKWDAKQNAAVERKPGDNTAKGSGDRDVVRVETSLVVSDVLVLDQRGQPVHGLTQTDFVITEDGKPQ